MRPQRSTPQDSPAALTPAIRPRAAFRISAVEALPGYRLHVRFVDGLEGSVYMRALIHSPKAGVFAALTDLEIFGKVAVEYGAVTWPGELDLAPDAMYAAIKVSGEWVLD